MRAAPLARPCSRSRGITADTAVHSADASARHHCHRTHTRSTPDPVPLQLPQSEVTLPIGGAQALEALPPTHVTRLSSSVLDWGVITSTPFQENPFLFPLPHRFFTPAQRDTERTEEGGSKAGRARALRGARSRLRPGRRRQCPAQGWSPRRAPRRRVMVMAPPATCVRPVARCFGTRCVWRERGGGGGETAAFGAGRGDLRRCARLAIYSGCKSAALGLCAVTLSRAHGARRGRDGTGCAGVIGNARHAAGSLSRARAFCMMRGGTWACSGHGPVSEVC